MKCVAIMYYKLKLSLFVCIGYTRQAKNLILDNICILVIYCPGFDVIKFEINFSFLIKPFCNMTKKVRTAI